MFQFFCVLLYVCTSTSDFIPTILFLLYCTRSLGFQNSIRIFQRGLPFTFLFHGFRNWFHSILVAPVICCFNTTFAIILILHFLFLRYFDKLVLRVFGLWISDPSITYYMTCCLLPYKFQTQFPVFTSVLRFYSINLVLSGVFLVLHTTKRCQFSFYPQKALLTRICAVVWLYVTHLCSSKISKFIIQTLFRVFIPLWVRTVFGAITHVPTYMKFITCLSTHLIMFCYYIYRHKCNSPYTCTFIHFVFSFSRRRFRPRLCVQHT